ncbi:MAG: acyl-CoA thioesterase [Anaerolineales bacterium]|nr:acyl-CoA thioesterase [Anaerolineales bacterium]
MPLTFTRKFRVCYSELDAYGHVNNAVYLRCMQETALDASAARYDLDRYRALNRAWLIHETDIEYLHPLKSGVTSTELPRKTIWAAKILNPRSHTKELVCSS